MSKLFNFFLLITSILCPFKTNSNSIFSVCFDEPFLNPEIVLIQRYDDYDGNDYYNDTADIRYAEQLIKDDGVFENGYDCVFLDDLFEFSSDEYRTLLNQENPEPYNYFFPENDGFYSENNCEEFSFSNFSLYSTLLIEIDMVFKKVYDGYQHFYIYNNASSNAILLRSGKYGSEISSNYEGITLKFEIETSLIQNYSFCIRYGASGFARDDWMNQIVKVRAALSNGEISTDYLYYTRDPIIGTAYPMEKVL